MTETLLARRGDETVATEVEVPQTLIDAIRERIATQPGAQLSDEQIIAAARAGLEYGGTLVNGFMPERSVLGRYARELCDLGTQAIHTNAYIPTVVAVDCAARYAKSQLPAEHE